MNAKDNHGRTPLHYLYRARPTKLVEQFLEHVHNEYGIEFNVDAVDNDGKTPIEFSK